MTWCHQVTSHYLNQCWPRSMIPYGITRPQWVNALSDMKSWQKYHTCYIMCGNINNCNNLHWQNAEPEEMVMLSWWPSLGLLWGTISSGLSHCNLLEDWNWKQYSNELQRLEGVLVQGTHFYKNSLTVINTIWLESNQTKISQKLCCSVFKG